MENKKTGETHLPVLTTYYTLVPSQNVFEYFVHKAEKIFFLPSQSGEEVREDVEEMVKQFKLKIYRSDKFASYFIIWWFRKAPLAFIK